MRHPPHVVSTGRRPRRIAGALAGGTARVAVPTAQGASDGDRASARRGALWLAGEPPAGLPAGQQADVMVALRLTGTPPAALRTRLRSLTKAAPAYADTAGAAAKVVMGAVAAGADPAHLGGIDYLARIRTASPRPGRYGTSSFDQALSMIALRTATGRVPGAAATTLITLRSGPGWNLGLTRSAPPDVDSTALSVVALRAAGTACSSAVIREARAWLASRRTRGGWTVYPGTGPNANSTALVARADIACGQAATGALGVIRSLQDRSGAIRYTAGDPESRMLATADAVPALVGASLARGLNPG